MTQFKIRKNAIQWGISIFTSLFFPTAHAGESTSLTLESLPPVIMESILPWLSYEDTYSLGKTSSKLKNVIEKHYDQLLFDEEIALAQHLSECPPSCLKIRDTRKIKYFYCNRNDSSHSIGGRVIVPSLYNEYEHDIETYLIDYIEITWQTNYDTDFFDKKMGQPHSFPAYFWDEVFKPILGNREQNGDFSMYHLYMSLPLLKFIRYSIGDIEKMLDPLMPYDYSRVDYNKIPKRFRDSPPPVLPKETWKHIAEQVDKLDSYVSAYRLKFERHARRAGQNGTLPPCCHRSETRVKDELLGFAPAATVTSEPITVEQLCQHTLGYLSAALNPTAYSVLESLIRAGGFDHPWSRKPIFTLLKCLGCPDIFSQQLMHPEADIQYPFKGYGYLKYEERVGQFNSVLKKWLEENKIPEFLKDYIVQNLGKRTQLAQGANYHLAQGANYTKVMYTLYQLFPETRLELEQYAKEKQKTLPQPSDYSLEFKPSSFSWRIKSLLPSMGIGAVVAGIVSFILKKPLEKLSQKIIQVLSNKINHYKGRTEEDEAAQKLKTRLQWIIPKVCRITTAILLGGISFKISWFVQNKYYPRYGWKYITPKEV